ncbi:hypothetical protein NC653_020290 [Populus alba x Populus x berolinensis]|uniref:FAE domain-containing protein n=1 Tax=Populus alba x Populus x berolinensis TaxID=444605 RepID=A0AAD6QDM7_9ROSI|nr:hypothetical protein NC653_020290 [Populus alba x Populus x berolinensis]
MAYECYEAPEDRKLDTDTCARIVLGNKNLGLQEHKFLLKTIVSSGIGEETYGPRNVISGQEDSPTLKDSISELDDLIFDTLDKLFAKTGISPSEIDILVVNVSLFSPAPSLTARVVNRYKMRSNVKPFNLSGMGCSASIVAIDLVQHLFKSYKNAFAIVVSTESLGSNWYQDRKIHDALKLPLPFRRLLNALHKQQCFKTSSYLQIEACRAYASWLKRRGLRICCIQVADDLGYKGFLLAKSLKISAAKKSYNGKIPRWKEALHRHFNIRELWSHAYRLAEFNTKLVLGQQKLKNLWFLESLYHALSARTELSRLL